MNRSSYRDRDYAFGQAMLTLRTAIGLTQAGLADSLGVSRRAVGDWEAGSSYPKTEHLKQLVGLAIEHRAFPNGREVEEVHALWQAAHQKVWLDEAWLAALLFHAEAPRASRPVEETGSTSPIPVHPAGAPRVDWGDALAVPNFYGREWELNLLSEWVVTERCRVVSVIGLGGIGKSALVVRLMHQLADRFEMVIWRSLRDLPTCEVLMDSLLQAVALQALGEAHASLERRQSFLLQYLRSARVLLVLDNLEAVLEEGEGAGRMRAGYEGFGRFLRLSAETEHQSCVLLTSREKPNGFVAQEGSRSPVRVLRLAWLDANSCEQLLAEKGVAGSTPERARLIEAYAGNPLALKTVAQTIVDLFDGEIAPFLEQGEIIFGGVRELLSQQFARLSALEQCVLLWLAILREPATLDELEAVLISPVPRARLLEAVDALRRRSLIERGQEQGSFTLQSVVLEYATAQLIAEAGGEIQEGRLARLVEHGLELAQAREYVRQTQQRLIVAPVLAHLRSEYPRQATVEEQLLALLARLPKLTEDAQGYGPANLVALLRLQRGNLRGLDLSRLALRGAYLQDVEMQDASLSESMIQDSVFTESFESVWDVAISPCGEYWAAASRRGEIWVWGLGGQILLKVWQAHDAYSWTFRFSPDGRTLASGGADSTVKLWDFASGTLLWSGRHTSFVNRVGFSPDGSLLGSAGSDACVRFWDLSNGKQLQIVPHPAAVATLAWSPDGRLLATSDLEGSIRLWEVNTTEPSICIQTLMGHTGRIDGLVFSPDGKLLASAGWDGMVKLWEVATGRLFETLDRHTDRVNRVIWSPDGRTLASSSADQTIWLWDVEKGNYRAMLRGHSAGVNGLAFTPDSRSLLSSSEDGTMRVWDVASGYCLRIIHGNVTTLRDVDWSPDGTHLISGGLDALVILFDITGATPPRILHEHGNVVRGVAWSADGRRLATSGWDNTIRLWDPISGDCLHVLQYPDDPDNLFYQLAWSPNGERIACGTYRHGLTMFDLTASHHVRGEDPLPTWICAVAWSPDGTRLAGGGIGVDNATVYIWDAADGTVFQQLKGHYYMISCVAWSVDGTRLASGGNGKEGGELFIWDPRRGERVCSLAGHPATVYGVAWGSRDEMLITACGDGTLRWWNARSGECLWIREAHQGLVLSLRRSRDGTKLASCGDDGAIMLWDLDSGEHLQTLRRDRPYERLNITGIRGLTEAQKATLRALGAFEEMV